MELTVTNDPQTEYYIIIESDEKIQNAWHTLFSSIPHAELLITGSINEALCAWTRLFLNDCLPRCVIVDWKQSWNEVSATEGNVHREGPHYFLHYCLDISSEGTFIIYTNDHEKVETDLEHDTLVKPHVTIVHKNKYAPQDVLDIIRGSPSFTRQTSGFYTLA